ncbi:hypothetical protein Scep_027753 [Stephania cephalantha]|uniref:Uncharacterized protein n=1 Tax=Stephania cephalantha TaxID=152367 RepID=A0AAP0E8M0_9MAGN
MLRVSARNSRRGSSEEEEEDDDDDGQRPRRQRADSSCSGKRGQQLQGRRTAVRQRRDRPIGSGPAVAGEEAVLHQQGSRQWWPTAELCDAARRRDEAAWAQQQRRSGAAVGSGDRQRPDCETTASSGDTWSGAACERRGQLQARGTAAHGRRMTGSKRAAVAARRGCWTARRRARAAAAAEQAVAGVGAGSAGEGSGGATVTTSASARQRGRLGSGNDAIALSDRSEA